MQPPTDLLQLKAGVDYPRSEAEFRSLLATTPKCRALLAKLIDWPGSRRCPTCHSVMKVSGKPGIAVCSNDMCSHREALTQGTIFQRTRTDLAYWVFAAWLIVDIKDGLSATSLADLLSTHPKAFRLIDTNLARTMLQAYRKVMAGANSKIKMSASVAMGSVALPRKNHPLVTVRVLVEDQGPGKLGRMQAHLVAEGKDPMPHGRMEAGSPGVQSTRMVSPIQPIAGRILKFLADDYGGSVHSENLQDYLDEFVFRWNHRGETNRGKVFCHLLAEAMSNEIHKSKVAAPSTTGKGTVSDLAPSKGRSK